MHDRVAAFLRDPSCEPFDDLALAVARLQFDTVAPYARLCTSLGRNPHDLVDADQIAPVPTLAFKREAFAVAPAARVFRSSGTRGAGRSEHHQPWPDLYDLSVDLTFPAACLPAPAPVAMLSLVPEVQALPDSSLAHMVDRIVRRWGAAGSTWVLGPGGLDLAAATTWLGHATRSPAPVLLLATSFALVGLLEALGDRRFALPAGSVLFETGGYKGRSRELSREDLTTLVGSHLGIGRLRIVREYGMSELSSQLYASSLTGGDPERFVAPPWARVAVLDPVTLTAQPPGVAGLVTVLDLANAGSVVRVLTEDLGRLDHQGRLELLGRASEAELRGCSLVAEAWMGSGGD
jgi:hypothetical protein